jgi:hypothetical protein
MPGNTLHSMFACAHPHVKHVVTCSVEQATDAQESELPGPLDGSFPHLRSQAAKISQGKKVDRIIALRPDKVP